MEPLSASDVKYRRMVVVALLTALAASLLVDPARPLGGKDMCGFHLLTGLPCPTCGMTRSLCSISHGRLTESWQFHPLGILVYAAALGWLAISATELIRGRKLNWPPKRARLSLLVAVVALVLAVWMVRIRWIIKCDPSVFHDSLIYRAMAAARLL